VRLAKQGGPLNDIAVKLHKPAAEFGSEVAAKAMTSALEASDITIAILKSQVECISHDLGWATKCATVNAFVCALLSRYPFLLVTARATEATARATAAELRHAVAEPFIVGRRSAEEEPWRRLAAAHASIAPTPTPTTSRPIDRIEFAGGESEFDEVPTVVDDEDFDDLEAEGEMIDLEPRDMALLC
jgi:hypothetical protein